CNVEPSERWMETMLHEFGHAVYDRECNRALPWLARGPAHSLTTEGIAMLFGRLTRDPAWLAGVAGVAPGTVEALRPRLHAARRGRAARARCVRAGSIAPVGRARDPRDRRAAGRVALGAPARRLNDGRLIHGTRARRARNRGRGRFARRGPRHCRSPGAR